MSTHTTNLNLVKPGATDPVNVSDINGNMDIIDDAVQGLRESVSLNNVKSVVMDIDFAHSYVWVRCNASTPGSYMTLELSSNAITWIKYVNNVPTVMWSK